MKKFLYIVLSLIILLVCTSLFLRYRYEKKFNSDYEMLEKEMLLKDSDNKGYSDYVQERINKLGFSGTTKLSIEKHAKHYRQVVRSKDKKTFIQNSKKMLQSSACSFYRISQVDPNNIPELTRDVLSDTKDMYLYYEYLDLIKFAQARPEIMEFLNDFSKRVNDEQDFVRLCGENSLD